MSNQVQRLLSALKSERESLQERVSSLVSSCEDCVPKDVGRPTKTLHRTCSLSHMNDFEVALHEPTASENQTSLTASHTVTPVVSKHTTTFDESQTLMGVDMENFLFEEATALKQVVDQLGRLEQLCQERLLSKERMRSLQGQLDESKSTLRSLCRENIKLNTAVKVGRSERESLKKKIAELTICLEESKQKYRKIRVTILASKGRSAIEKRKQEAMTKVKKESADTVMQEKVKSLPDRTQPLRTTIAKKDETIASYLAELTALQAEHAKFTEQLRDMQHELKERDWQVSNLKNQLDAIQEENAALSREKSELATRLEEVESRYVETTGCLEVSLTKTETQLSQARQTLEDSRKEHEHQLDQSAQENAELKAALADAARCNERQALDVLALKERIDKLRSDLSCERVHTRRMVEVSAARCQELAQRACFLELQQHNMLSELKS